MKTVIQYVRRCAEILLEMRTKSDAVETNMQLQFNATETASYKGIDEAVRVRITREVQQKAKALNFSNISGFHLIAGLKAKIRGGLMKKESLLTSIALTKAEAMQIDQFLEKKNPQNSKKSFLNRLVVTFVKDFAL